MNKVTNRLKLVDGFFRDNGYYNHYSSESEIKDFFDIDKIDGFLSKIEDNLTEFIENKKTFYFMYKQNNSVFSYLEDNMKKHKALFDDYVGNEKYSKLVTFKDTSEVDVFEDALKVVESDFAKEFLYTLRDGSSKDRITKVISFFYKNKLGKNCEKDVYEIRKSDLKSFIENNNIWSLSDKEILNVIENNNELLFSFESLTKEDIDIIKNKNARFLYKLDRLTLNLLDRMIDIIEKECNTAEDKYMFKEEYVYGGFKEIVYNLKEDINAFVDVVCEKYEDNETRAHIIKCLLDSFTYDMLSSKKDLELLTNKIRYDFKPREVKDIGLEFTGIKENIYIESDLNNNSLSFFMNLKDIVPKGFYKKVINRSDFVNDILFASKEDMISLSNMLELGQLNEEQIKTILLYINENRLSIRKFLESFSEIEYKLSFDEFVFIYENRRKLFLANLNKLKDMKQTARLLKLKYIVELNTLLSVKKFCVDKSEIESFVGENNNIQDLLKKDNQLGIKDLGDYIEYKIINKAKTVDSIDNLNKIKFLLKNGVSLDEVSKLDNKEIDEKIWSNKKVSSIVKKMNLSDDFNAKYRDGIINFCGSEYYDLVNAYYKNPYANESQKKSILLIGKSIIANKYKDLKFVREDIRKEISMDISDEAFETWKNTDVISKGSYTVQDSSDFNYIMKMGELPVRTCMNYVNGMYSHCLLSNFDTSKKMLVIHKNGKYVGRAILRLTVMSDKDSNESSLDFVDVDSNETAKKDSKTKKLVIFLEKMYSTLDSGDLKECYPMIVELLKDKAEKMGAKFVVSYNYDYFVGNDCTPKNRYMFITASKNGSQYLDSFDGSTSSSYCYKKGKVYIY